MAVIQQHIDRVQAAHSLTNRKTLYAAGAGLIPIPIIDAAALLGIQLTMLHSIAQLYNIEFKQHLAKSIIGSLAGSAGAVGLVKMIPGIGTVAGSATTAVTGAAATYALGRVFTQHFDQGGTLLNFDPVASREYFQKEYKAGSQFIAQQNGRSSNGIVGLKAIPALPVIGTFASEEQQLLEESAQLQLAIQELQTAIDEYKSSIGETTSQETTIDALSKEQEASTKQTVADASSINQVVDFTSIEGIDSKVSVALKEAGIDSLKQLAATKVTTLKKILKEAEGNFNLIDPTSWPLQALLAVAGKTEELKKLQEDLKGGRYKE